MPRMCFACFICWIVLPALLSAMGIASFLAQDALFICIGGVNALNGLNDTIRSLGVREVVEAMDMDQMTNPNVRSAILTMRKEVRKIPGIRYSKYTWNPAYKGVDDYLLSQAATM